MKNKQVDILKQINIGVRRGVAKALDEHKRMGRPIVIWENGKIVHVPPEDIVIPEYPDDHQLDE